LDWQPARHLLCELLANFTAAAADGCRGGGKDGIRELAAAERLDNAGQILRLLGD
jgi:hypothetical protein